MFAAPNPEQKKVLIEFCHAELATQTQYLSDKYGLVEYKPQLFINHRLNAAFNYGGELIDGEPYVTLVAKEICGNVGRTEQFVFEEYDFLRNKPGIGDGVANWKQYAAWNMAHELSHTLVECDRFRPKVQTYFAPYIANDVRGHGLLWQNIYRDLRVGFCTEERFPVVAVDYSNTVYYRNRKTKVQEEITFFRGTEPVEFYVRQSGKIWKSNRKFNRKYTTKHQNLGEIRKRLVSH